MRYVRRLCGLAIALALTLSAVAPARADDESVAMGVSLSEKPLCAELTQTGEQQTLTANVPEEPLPEETLPAESLPEETVPEETEETEETDATSDRFDWTEVYTHEFPLYSQLDYPNQRFGSGTVATSGCGITSLAMVASYLTGHTYYPDELAKYFGGYGENNVQRFEYGAQQLKLPIHKADTIRDVFAAMKNGDVAVLLMDHMSIFTETRHFIVLTGINEETAGICDCSHSPAN